jgi:hypothetical protein
LASSVREVVRKMAGKVTLDKANWKEKEDQAFPRIRGIVETVKETLHDFWDWEEG